MSILFSEHELVRLNVDPQALGAVERLPIPEPRVDEGRGERLAPFARESVRAPEGLRVRSDVLEALGIDARFDDRLHVLALTSPADWPMTLSRVEHPDGPDTSLQTIAPGGRSAFVRLPLLETFRFVIAGTEGSTLVLGSVDRGALQLQPVYPWPAPPLSEWIGAVVDEGLKALATDRLSADRWIQTTLAGVLARLQSSGPEVDPRARLAAIRDGRDTSPALKPRAWARSLSPSQRDALERFARMRTHSLSRRLASFLDRLTPDGPNLVERWRALCHERDDLEGVRVLLREAGVGDQLEAALREADSAGRAVRFSWPRDVDVDDERLRRAALSNPGAWWGSTRYGVNLL